MRPIALLTDFGTRDPYVAAMKGVIASRTAAPIHDLTHDIAPFDVFGAAWFLRAVVAYWPAGTIFVCVVDPGVGSARRIVVVEADGKTFLAPDNGLLHFVCATDTPVCPSMVSATRSSFFLPDGSNTFHGRDRFAPLAAAIANGTALDDLGPRIDDLVRLDYEPPSYGGDVVRGTIVAVDRFGNLITDIEAARVPFGAWRIGDIDRIETNYADAAPGPFLIAGSGGCVEISIANGSAADELHMSRLQKVELCPSAVPSYRS